MRWVHGCVWAQSKRRKGEKRKPATWTFWEAEVTEGKPGKHTWESAISLLPMLHHRRQSASDNRRARVDIDYETKCWWWSDKKKNPIKSANSKHTGADRRGEQRFPVLLRTERARAGNAQSGQSSAALRRATRVVPLPSALSQSVWHFHQRATPLIPLCAQTLLLMRTYQMAAGGGQTPPPARGSTPLGRGAWKQRGLGARGRSVSLIIPSARHWNPLCGSWASREKKKLQTFLKNY